MEIRSVTNYLGLTGPSSTSSARNRVNLAALAQMQFSDLDTNRAGSVSQADFEAALTKLAQGESGPAAAGVSSDKAAQLFKLIDTDDDGKINQTEWTAFQRKVLGHHHHGAPPDVAPTQSSTDPLTQLIQTANTNTANGYPTVSLNQLA